MTGHIVSPPTPEILLVAELFEEALSRVLKLYPSVHQTIERFEAPGEAMSLLNLVVRHVEAVTQLAKQDLVLLPSAAVVSRAAFDTSVRILWLLQPENEYEREARWLTHLRSEEDAHRRLSELIEQVGGNSAPWRERQSTLRQFREAVESELPAGISSPKQVANVRETLRAVGEERKYLYYITLSEYTHGGHGASWLYRRNLGSVRITGEFIFPEDWRVVLTATWLALTTAVFAIFSRQLPAAHPFESATFLSEIDQALARIQSAPPAA